MVGNNETSFEAVTQAVNAVFVNGAYMVLDEEPFALETMYLSDCQDALTNAPKLHAFAWKMATRINAQILARARTL